MCMDDTWVLHEVLFFRRGIGPLGRMGQWGVWTGRGMMVG